jgi:hypothetical protein
MSLKGKLEMASRRATFVLGDFQVSTWNLEKMGEEEDCFNHYSSQEVAAMQQPARRRPPLSLTALCARDVQLVSWMVPKQLLD